MVGGGSGGGGFTDGKKWGAFITPRGPLVTKCTVVLL